MTSRNLETNTKTRDYICELCTEEWYSLGPSSSRHHQQNVYYSNAYSKMQY